MRKGQKTSEKTREKQRQSNLGKRHKISSEGYEKMSANFVKGGWNKGLKSSIEWREKVRLANIGKKQSKETRLRRSQSMMGEKNPNYVDGKMRHGKQHYYDLRWKLWKDQVFKRDDYTCQECSTKGVYLQPHHIKGWTHYPELRYEISNGITLCIDCHKNTDNYCGRGIMRKKSLVE